jgi:hypothetical protein
MMDDGDPSGNAAAANSYLMAWRPYSNSVTKTLHINTFLLARETRPRIMEINAQINL